MYKIAKVAVENATLTYDKLYSYLLPGALESTVQPGCRVKIPFGGGNRSRTGIVLALDTVSDRQTLKPVAALLDAQPVLNPEGLMLLRFLKEHTFCTWFDALRLLIPVGIQIIHKTMYCLGNIPSEQTLSPRQSQMIGWIQKRHGKVEQSVFADYFQIRQPDSELIQLLDSGAILCTEQHNQRIRDEKVCMVRLTESCDYRRMTPKQKLAAAFLETSDTASIKEICYYVGITRAVLDNMKKRGFVEYFDHIRYRSPFLNAVKEVEAPSPLSPEQQAAFVALDALTQTPAPAPCLLFGVTGSGKTSVFMQLIASVTARGKTALVLLPEISLTTQVVENFRRRFGATVALLHSGLAMGERMDEWRRIQNGAASIVVGTRSAVFAPLQNIGLIVMDEEQEHTYHSEKSPRFHAREIAHLRCKWHKALFVLASATPAIETYYWAQQGKYHQVSLPTRYNQTALPDVYSIDMGDPANTSCSPIFSDRLLEEMHYNLTNGEQSILLLNRRGYATVVKCSSCGAVSECPHCSVAMTYHTANDSLLCHYCGYTHQKPTTCTQCGSPLIRYAGAGTQKIQEELSGLFSGARILRVDMDTTMAKFSHEQLFASFAAGEYDIMIGTQMVAKGLNFSNVTLVGVLSADQSLYAGDFRSFEQSFSLLTQVVGRCGRGEKRGRAFIQTYSPEHPVIQLSAQQDYPAFFQQEIQSRRLHLYPPFCNMVGIGFIGESLEDVQLWSTAFLSQFRALAAQQYAHLPLRALGPVPFDVLRAAGKYRYKILLKCRFSSALRALLQEMQTWFYRQCKIVSILIDMHYDHL